jgi:hypothetical protein
MIEDFLPDTLDDVYFRHLYAMSWFYDGVYPFDSFELEKDYYLYEVAYQKMIEDEVDAQLASYSDIF